MEGALEDANGGPRLAITVRDSAEHVWWSKTFSRGASEASAVQYDVARELAARIGAPLPATISGHAASMRPIDPRVYQAYARGRYFWNRRSKEDVQRALAEFTRAIEIDPSFAPAYAGLADSYMAVGGYGFAAGEEAWQQAIAAAEKALQLDPSLADGHASRGNIAWQYEWDWDRAGVEFRRALALNPGYANAHHSYGYYQLLIGKPREAEAEITAALELDPLSPIINANIGYARYIGRDYDGALAHLQRTLEMHPRFWLTHSYMGLVHVARGSYADAIAAFEKAIDAAGSPTDRARNILADLERPVPGRFVPSYYFALIYVGLGDKDRAFAALDRAFEERVGPINELQIDPMFDPLRDDPRFDALLRRLRLR